MSSGSAWCSGLGAVAIVFGVLLAATHANEWMKQVVIAKATPANQELPRAVCPEDELEEEGLSLAECEFLVINIQGRAASTPPWFPPLQTVLSALGTFVALFSIAVGVALASNRSWATGAALATFGALMAIDIAAFIAVMNAGPVLRSDYLWGLVLWFVVHMILTVGVLAGRQAEARTIPGIED